MFTQSDLITTATQNLPGQELGASRTARYAGKDLENTSELNKPPNHDPTDPILKILAVLKNEKEKVDYHQLIQDLRKLQDSRFNPSILKSSINGAINSQDFTDHDNAIDNISYLLNKKYDTNLYDERIQQDKHYFKFLIWLQEIFLLSELLNTEIYQKTLEDIHRFKKKSQLSFWDKLFRYAVAFNSGIGTSCCLFNWGPMALIGTIGGLTGFVFPPLGVLITVTSFGVLSFGLGIALVCSFLKTYQNEDSVLTTNVQQMENEVNNLAKEEAKLRQKYYYLSFDNMSLRHSLGIKQCPHIDPLISNECTDNDSTTSKKFRPKKFTNRWGRVVMSFVGTLGTVWGFPSIILATAGISLLVAGSSFGIGGLVLVGVTIALASLFAYKAYQYDKKSQNCEMELAKINENGIESIRNKLAATKKVVHELTMENDDLNAQFRKFRRPESLAQAKASADQVVESKEILKIPPPAEVNYASGTPSNTGLFKIPTQTEEVSAPTFSQEPQVTNPSP